MTDYILIAIAIIAALAVGSIARGWWDNRKATLLPRMVDAASALVAEINRLDAAQASPQTAAQAAIAKATLDAKMQALRESVAKLA